MTRPGISPVHRLDIRDAFETLTEKERLYAHHMARAAWHGARIVMRQTSREAIGIFDFVLGLHDHCGGDWSSLALDRGIDDEALQGFLEYAARFLSNVGNYYGSGDQKFVPNVDASSIAQMAAVTAELQSAFEDVRDDMFASPPYSLGFPSASAQSAYYPESDDITKEEIVRVSQHLESLGLFPENTRIRKSTSTDRSIFEVLIASANKHGGEIGQKSELPGDGGIIRLVHGDHSTELARICAAMRNAIPYAANNKQIASLEKYVKSFESGSLEVYRDSLRDWVQDKAPQVENIFGFVEPYRDPHGTRAEFEGLVAIPDAKETALLAKLVQDSATFIRRLPWATGDPLENDGKGPFEKSLFEPPDFSSIHSLAYCSSIIFPGINLPNYNDIRQEFGFKNVVIANRMTAESSDVEVSPFVDPNESEMFQKHKYPAYYWWVVLHELLGHGTGRMMVQENATTWNFDPENPPIDPVTLEPIATWYKPGQTWTGQFGDLATTVDECRAELVGAFLMDDPELLALFGYTQDTDITAADLTYNTYLQLGVDGLRGLQNYHTENKSWGSAHSRAHFATLKCLLTDGEGFMTVECDPASERLIVRVNRDEIVSRGKPALGNMLLRLHMYRCTADVSGCRSYYEDLSSVHGEHLDWRSIVLKKLPPKRLFVHANTFLEGEAVYLKEYPPTFEGIIESWAVRRV